MWHVLSLWQKCLLIFGWSFFFFWIRELSNCLCSFPFITKTCKKLFGPVSSFYERIMELSLVPDFTLYQRIAMNLLVPGFQSYETILPYCITEVSLVQISPFVSENYKINFVFRFPFILGKYQIRFCSSFPFESENCLLVPVFFLCHESVKPLWVPVFLLYQ